MDLQRKWFLQIGPSDLMSLNFYPVKLIAYARKRNVPLELFTIEVSEPLFKVFPKDEYGLTNGTGVFFPVSAKNTWALAAKYKQVSEKHEDALPLTRAVSDQAHNYVMDHYALQGVGGTANFVSQSDTDKDLHDFQKYTNYLTGTVYLSQRGKALVSGAHKVWALSSRDNVSPRPNDKPKAINYGAHFHGKRPSQDGNPPADPGPYLVQGYDTYQPLGGKHDCDHWDCSQLFQLMKNLRNKDGGLLDLRAALTKTGAPGHLAVWDEDLTGYKSKLENTDFDPL
jgi:hypothetical protein